MSNDIVIIGGGIAGLSLANSLAQKKIKSIVLESRADYGGIERGDVLHPLSIKFLKQLGLDLVGTNQTCNINEFNIFSNSGKTLINSKFGKNTYSQFLHSIEHSCIEKNLWTLTKASKFIDFRISCPVNTLKKVRNQNYIVESKQGNIEAKTVVIANGTHSKVRNLFFPNVQLKEYNQKFINCVFVNRSNIKNSAAYIIGNKGNLIYVTLPNQRIRIGLQVKRNTLLRNKEDILNTINSRNETMDTSKLELLDIHSYKLNNLKVQRHTPEENLYVIGDAFHTFHPIMGFGMNQAFKDVHLLSNLIAQHQITDRKINKNYFYKRRTSSVRKTHLITNYFNQIGNIKNDASISIRNSCMQIFNRSKFLKRHFLKYSEILY